MRLTPAWAEYMLAIYLLFVVFVFLLRQVSYMLLVASMEKHGGRNGLTPRSQENPLDVNQVAQAMQLQVPLERSRTLTPPPTLQEERFFRGWLC